MSLGARDVLAVGSIGLRSRRLRAALSGLGVAIGIASMVAVLGISASSQEELLSTIDRLGTNLLSIEPGQALLGEEPELPPEGPARLRGVPGVEAVAPVLAVDDATVRRTRYVDPDSTSGITVLAAGTDLPTTVGATLASGRFLDGATEGVPAVVLGSVAARRLGLDDVRAEPLVWIGDRYWRVVGILAPVTLASELDRSAIVGRAAAEDLLGGALETTRVYLRADEDALPAVRAVTAATTNPEAPEEVAVSRPSDALEAKAAAEGAFTSLLLGLGAVALLVGGVGIANVMVISVLERRAEIGLRRALGATRRDVVAQFLCESLLLAAMGGVAGAALGALATAVSGLVQDGPIVVPPEAIAGGIAAAIAIGALAGLYPSLRAARLAPTEALRAV